MQYLNYEDLKK